MVVVEEFSFIIMLLIEIEYVYVYKSFDCVVERNADSDVQYCVVLSKMYPDT